MVELIIWRLVIQDHVHNEYIILTGHQTIHVQHFEVSTLDGRNDVLLCLTSDLEI